MPARFNDYLRDDDEEETSAGQWLITFADMSLLMLTFFILLFSFLRGIQPFIYTRKPKRLALKARCAARLRAPLRYFRSARAFQV